MFLTDNTQAETLEEKLIKSLKDLSSGSGFYNNENGFVKSFRGFREITRFKHRC